MSNVPHSGRRLPVRLVVSFIVCLGLVSGARAQQPQPPEEMPAPAHTAAAPSPLTLTDCVRIGLAQQPVLAAQWASRAAAGGRCGALDPVGGAGVLSKALKFRKGRGCGGVSTAQAGLAPLEWDTPYAVTRCYYTVVYARRQEQVARDLLEKVQVAR